MRDKVMGWDCSEVIKAVANNNNSVKHYYLYCCLLQMCLVSDCSVWDLSKWDKYSWHTLEPQSLSSVYTMHPKTLISISSKIKEPENE